MKMKNVVLAVAVLSGVVRVKLGSELYVLGGGDSRVLGARAQRRAPPPESVRGRVVLVKRQAKMILEDRNGEEAYELAKDVRFHHRRQTGQDRHFGRGIRSSSWNAWRTRGPSPSYRLGPTIGGDVKSIDAEKRAAGGKADGRRGEQLNRPSLWLQTSASWTTSLQARRYPAGHARGGEIVQVDRKMVVSIIKGGGRRDAGPGEGREKGRAAATHAAGRVISADASMILLENRNGITNYELAKNVQADGKPAKIEDLVKDTSVTLGRRSPTDHSHYMAEGPAIGGRSSRSTL